MSILRKTPKHGFGHHEVSITWETKTGISIAQWLENHYVKGDLEHQMKMVDEMMPHYFDTAFDNFYNYYVFLFAMQQEGIFAGPRATKKSFDMCLKSFKHHYTVASQWLSGAAINLPNIKHEMEEFIKDIDSVQITRPLQIKYSKLSEQYKKVLKENLELKEKIEAEASFEDEEIRSIKDFNREAVSHIFATKEKIKGYEKTIERLEIEIEAAKRTTSKIMDDAQQHLLSKQELEREKSSNEILQNRIKDLEESIAELAKKKKKRSSQPKDVTSLKQEIEALKGNLADIQSEYSSFKYISDGTMSEFRTKISDKEDELGMMKKREEQIKELLKKAYDEIKALKEVPPLESLKRRTNDTPFNLDPSLIQGLVDYYKRVEGNEKKAIKRVSMLIAYNFVDSMSNVNLFKEDHAMAMGPTYEFVRSWLTKSKDPVASKDYKKSAVWRSLQSDSD